MKRTLLIFLVAVFGFGLQAQIKKEAVDVYTSTTDPIYVQEINPGGSTPIANFKIGTEGGTATYLSTTTITLGGTYPAITNNAQLSWVKYVRSDASGYYINGQGGITLTHSGGVVTIVGSATDVIASGDALEVGINAPKIETDYTAEAYRNVDLNPSWSRYTDPVSLTTANDTLTTSWTDHGTEIDVKGYKKLLVYVTLDINESNNARIRLLPKWESGGTDEYNQMIATDSTSFIYVVPKYVEWGTDADQLSVIEFDVAGYDYVQIQKQIGTDGGTDAIFTTPTKIKKIY